MSALKFAQSEKIFNPFSRDFWREDTRRTARLRLADAGDDPSCWDVQAREPGERSRRLAAMEAAGFERVVVVRRSPLGRRDFYIETRHLFVHREARIEDDERTARMLMCLHERNYVLPEFRHLSAFETWAMDGPGGQTLAQMRTRARPTKAEVAHMMEDEAERILEAKNEPLSDEEEREIEASDARLATILKKKGRLGLLSQEVVRKRLSAAHGRDEDRRAALDGWRRDNIISLTRWRDQRLAGGDALLPAAEPFFFDKRRSLPELSQLKLTRSPAPSRDEDADTRPSQENEGAVSKKPAKSLFPFVLASELAGKPIPRREWHVEGLIPARNVTLLYGDGGTGKSLLSLQLAVSTALGIPWIDVQTETAHGPCLFLTAEDELDEVHRRLADIVKSHGVRIDDLDNLVISSLAGEDALLGAPKDKGGEIQATKLYKVLAGVIAKMRPALVVLDTLADLFGGDENQRSQARQFITLIRKLALDNNTAIVVLAHPSLSGMASGTGASGNTAWNNSVRSRLYFERVRGEGGIEDDPDARVLKSMKSNYGRVGDVMRLRWANGVFVTGTRPGGAENFIAAEAERVFLELLATYDRDGRHVSDTPSANYAPAVFARDQRARGTSKRALVGAMNNLFETGKIAVVNVGPPSRPRKRLTLAEWTVNGNREVGDDG